MMATLSTYVPMYLDEPERLLIWTIDEAMVLVLPIFVGVMMGFFGTGFVAGAILVSVYAQAKSRIGQHLLPGLLYWYLPLSLSRFRATPPSYIREYVG